MRLAIKSFAGINPALDNSKLTASLAAVCHNALPHYGGLQGIELPVIVGSAGSGKKTIAVNHESQLFTSSDKSYGVVQETARQSHLTYTSDGVVVDSVVHSTSVTQPADITLSYSDAEISDRQYVNNYQHLGALWQQLGDKTDNPKYAGRDMLHEDDGTFDSASVRMPDELRRHLYPIDRVDPANPDTDDDYYSAFDTYTHAELYPNFTPTAYVITYVDKWGRESKPSAPASSLDPANADRPITIILPNVSDTDIDRVRVYRAVSNPHSKDDPVAAQSVFLPIVDIAATSTSYLVDVPINVQGAIPLESHHYADAPTKLRYLVESDSGLLACVGDTPNEVLLSFPHQWNAWSTRRVINLPSGADVRDVVANGNMIYILTATGNYLAQITQDTGVGGVQLQVRRVNTPANILDGTRAAKTEYGCVYASDQGLIAIGGVSARMLTERLIPADTWRRMQVDNPVQHITEYRGKLYVFRRDSTDIFNFPDKVFGDTVEAVYYTCEVMAVSAAVTPLGELYLLHDNGDISTWNPDNTSDTTQWEYVSRTVLTDERIQITAGRAEGSFIGDVTPIGDEINGDTMPMSPDNRRVRCNRCTASSTFAIHVVGIKRLNKLVLGSNVTAISRHQQ